MFFLLPTSGGNGTFVITVTAPLQELFTGYLQWAHDHPPVSAENQHLIPSASRQLGGSNHAASATTPLPVRMPSLDLYSSSGVSLYHGTNSEKNAAFIRALPGSISDKGQSGTEIRPTLQEAVAMFQELKQYKVNDSSGPQYTIFELTYADTALCRAQNEATLELQARAKRLRIQVIEIELRQ